MKKLSVLLMVFGLVVGGSGLASASPLLFDRGLPTANLNNDAGVAGVDRSNVAWAFGADTALRYLAGDDFTLGGSGDYLVDTIRVWSVANSAGLSLWFGAEDGTLSQLSSPTITSVTYSDGSAYQRSSGPFTQIYQLDFSLNQVLSGATTYQFFLDGPSAANSAAYAFLHSSNAALSGSTQQGADNQYLWAQGAVAGGAVTFGGTIDSNGDGWDKSSDGNVQVFGTQAVPEPATLTLVGLGFLGVGTRKLRARRA